MTGQQIKYVRFLMTKAGMIDQKEEVVLAITDGRTSSLRDMTQEETQALIKSLGEDENQAIKSRMVRKILSMAHEMGWEKDGGKVDMERVNNWCKKYTTSKKPLDELTLKELPAVVTIFEKAYLSFLKGI
jgi:hypothetical protein